MATEFVGAVVQKTQSARATTRMQRSRNRRRAGLCCYTVELRDTEVEALVDLGLLASAERANNRSVIRAIHSFFDETLGKVRAAQPGSR